MREFKRIGLLLFAAISGYLLQLIDGANLVINPSGQTQNQPAGKGFGLTCQGEADNTDLFSEMKWFGPKGELVEGNSGPIEVSKAGNTLLLMFKIPTAEDSGMYNCSAVYDSIDRLNTGVHLVFYKDITWEDCPPMQALVINNDGKIRCRVSANPPATITWSKDNQPLPERYVMENDGIRVTGVKEEDEGEFLVRAMVPQTGRFQNRLIKVEVHVPPEIIELNDKTEAIEGNEAMLRCQASGFPRPSYDWFDPDQRDLSKLDGYIVDKDTGTLTIRSIKRENQGRYTCRAKNPAGDAKRHLDLTVIVKPEIKQFNNVTVVENGDATFECRAAGDPLPDLNIRKGTDKVFDNENDRVRITKQNEAGETVLTLKIQRAIRSDDGLYYCTAENKGASAERVGHLTVEFSPVMSRTPSTSVKSWNGNPVNLTCIAEAIPNATISWFYLGQKIQDDDFYTIYGRTAYSNLLVRPPGDVRGSSNNVYGTYKCQAENSHGSQFIHIELQEARKPSGLSDVRTVKETATTITFEFVGPHDDGGLPIRAYVVNYYEENEPYDKVTSHEWTEGFPYVLQNLRPRTAYKFSFAARNDVGIGEYTEDKRIVMPEESSPESPKFITPRGNVSTYPDRIQIRWTLPLDNGRKIDYFQVRYFESVNRDGLWHRVGDPIVKQVRDWENAPLYEMKNLKANTFYKVEVRAHNDIGYSQVATMVFQTAADPSKGTQGSSHIHMPGTGPDHQSSDYHGGAPSSLSTGIIAAIIVALVLVILIIVDITCYVRYHWGLVFFLRSRVCAKPMVNEKAKEAAFEDGKGGGNEANANNGNIKLDAENTANVEKGDNFEKKTKTEVDNPAFDKEKEPLKVTEENEKDNDGEVATEDTPMIQSSGAKDTKPGDANTDDMKNKSPKGSKSSIAKDSLV